MVNLTCIICPVGCSLIVDDKTLNNTDSGAYSESEKEADLSVTGNRCRRGLVYAREEISSPKRTVTATCRITDNGHPVRRLPVKTSIPCPKEKISDLLTDIYKKTVALPVHSGDIVISDWMGLGINIISTRTVNN